MTLRYFTVFSLGDAMQEQIEQSNYETFEAHVVMRYGLLMGSNELMEALGFAALASFRQACKRGNINLPMFKIKGRSGRFALSHDVAKWIWKLRNEESVTE